MKIVGCAMPVLFEADVFDEVSSTARGPLGARPFGLMLEALDDLKPHEVYIATGGSFRYAFSGELMSTSCNAFPEAAGAVFLEWLCSRRSGHRGAEFPTFCRGAYAQDQGPRGKVIDFRSVIEIEGDTHRPGRHRLLGDREGVLIIPASVEREVVAAALEKAATENRVAIAIRTGMSAS